MVRSLADRTFQLRFALSGSAFGGKFADSSAVWTPAGSQDSWFPAPSQPVRAPAEGYVGRNLWLIDQNDWLINLLKNVLMKQPRTSCLESKY